jgi:hypothetical protein
MSAHVHPMFQKRTLFFDTYTCYDELTYRNRIGTKYAYIDIDGIFGQKVYDNIKDSENGEKEKNPCST